VTRARTPESRIPGSAVIAGLGGYALAGGLVSLVGWAANVPRLTDWDGRGISIQPNATLASLCAGAAVLLLSRGRARPAAALGAVVGLIGASALIQYVAGFNLEVVNTALMFGREWGREGVIHPGRMGPPGATCWTLIGGALLALGVLRRRRAAHALALVTFFIATLSITGYLYRVDTLYSLPYLTVIAFQTATFIAAVSAGMVAAVPERPPMHWLLHRGATGVIARRGIPFIFLAPVTFGWLRLTGETAGLYESRFGVALFSLLFIGLLLGMLAWCLSTVSRHEKALLESEQALRDADRRKDEFLAVLAHELRNPLAPIGNAVQLLRRTVGAESGLRSISEILTRQVAQLIRLVDDLLDLSRIARGKIALRVVRTELAPVVSQAVESVEPLVRAKSHELRVALPPEPIALRADPVRLAQVIGNLLSNACKFTAKGGLIELVVARESDSVAIRVRDNGSGIPPDQLARIFDMFTQVDASLEGTEGGLGIGLTLVKTLVELHGGKVHAWSGGTGCGSEFVVLLPAFAEPG
jgi:signal transduction histidine kinase